MMIKQHILIPLQGPDGVRPKAPAVGAWQSPGYQGAFVHNWTAESGEWFGLRCDELVVVDCDNADANDYWVERTFPHRTWVRKTPRGWHHIYSRVNDSPDAPAADIFKGHPSGIDIRAGRTSQIVYYAPGYEDETDSLQLMTFCPKWLPENYGQATLELRPEDEWSEMPDGRGNNTMAAIAGAMRKQGMDGVTIAKCLGAINRITMTRDPMPREMIVQIVQSICRYKPKPDIDIEIDE